MGNQIDKMKLKEKTIDILTFIAALVGVTIDILDLQGLLKSLPKEDFFN